jgi:hypothetical protein
MRDRKLSFGLTAAQAMLLAVLTVPTVLAQTVTNIHSFSNPGGSQDSIPATGVQTRMEQTIISFDPPGSTYTIPTAINQSGEVAGYYTTDGNTGEAHGFLRQPGGTIVAFDPPGSTGTLAYGINTSGMIVGHYVDGANYGFIRQANGEFITFDASVGGSGFGTFPVAINDSGEVVGSSKDQFGAQHSFLRDAAGNITIFDPPGFEGDWAGSINSNGEIAGSALEGGFSAYVRDPSGNITVFTVPGEGYDGTLAGPINRSGQVVGIYYDQNNFSHGFIRDTTGDFTTFQAPGGTTYTGGINDSGEVVGWVVSSGSNYTGFLRAANSTITLFRAPLAGTSFNEGTYPAGINDSGDTTGFYVDSEGVYHGFIGF